MRKSSHERGYDHRWRGYRTRFLAAHPLCAGFREAHPDQLTPATVVDHIVPHRGNKRLFWDAINHQALCKSCHDRKTATEDGGFGR